MGKNIKKKKVNVDFLFSFPPPTIPENLTMIKRNRVKFLSLSLFLSLLDFMLVHVDCWPVVFDLSAYKAHVQLYNIQCD